MSRIEKRIKFIAKKQGLTIKWYNNTADLLDSNNKVQLRAYTDGTFYSYGIELENFKECLKWFGLVKF